MARLLLPVSEPRTRIDAATWGTMGVGLGSAIAAAVVHGGKRVAVAVEGVSAFGFSVSQGAARVCRINYQSIAVYLVPARILIATSMPV